mmetsp:Transcript_25116/g.79589  ORF Transcript_25116/g.79589 Transcript_25116/m.79589 type:complete len:235 (-) Transcript_25116:594-1298(-)
MKAFFLIFLLLILLKSWKIEASFASQTLLYSEYHKNRTSCSACKTYTPFKHFILKSNKVLDLGAGNCRFLRVLLDQNVDAYGVEFSEDALRLHCSDLLLSGKVMAGNFMALPFPDNFFDMVLSFEVFEHIPEEWVERSIQGLARVLDGVFLGSIAMKRAGRDPPWPAPAKLHVTLKTRKWWDDMFAKSHCYPIGTILKAIQRYKKHSKAYDKGIEFVGGKEIKPHYFAYNCTSH